MARGAWDRTAALMYAVAACSFGGSKLKITADHLNPYRNAKRGMSVGDWFGAMRQAKAEQDARSASSGS